MTIQPIQHRSIASLRNAINEAVRRIREGDVVAAATVADLWDELDHLMSTGATVPPQWAPASPISPGVSPANSIVESTDGEFRFDFDAPPTPSYDKFDEATITMGGATPVELAEGTQTRQTAHVLTLHEPSRLTRHNHHDIDAPTTSVAAFNQASPSMACAIFFLIHDAGERGFTDEELETRLDAKHQSVSSARRGLVKQGYLKASGLTRQTSSNRAAQVHIATPIARLRVEHGREVRP